MPRFKTSDHGLKKIPVDFDRQVIPGSFEHALCHLVDLVIDLSELVARYRNDTTGEDGEVAHAAQRQRQTAAEQSHRQRVGQDGHRQMRDPGLHRRHRSRDARYAGQASHKAKPDPLWDKRKAAKEDALLPACRLYPGRRPLTLYFPGRQEAIYSNGSNCTFNGYAAMKFRGAERDCVPCALRDQCLRTPDKTRARQISFFQGKRMIIARFATVEPVFGNLRNNKRLPHFTLRGRAKVDGQWKHYCLVHNIEKLAHHGYAQ